MENRGVNNKGIKNRKNIYNQSDFGIDHLWCPCVQLSIVLLEGSVCYEQSILLAKLC